MLHGLWDGYISVWDQWRRYKDLSTGWLIYRYAIIEYNKVDLSLRLCPSVKQFQKIWLGNISQKRLWYYVGKSKTSIIIMIIAKLRMKCSAPSGHMYDLNIILIVQSVFAVIIVKIVIISCLSVLYSFFSEKSCLQNWIFKVLILP